jgi:hypothetical protein
MPNQRAREGAAAMNLQLSPRRSLEFRDLLDDVSLDQR